MLKRKEEKKGILFFFSYFETTIYYYIHFPILNELPTWEMSVKISQPLYF